jgi:hypothetical protein
MIAMPIAAALLMLQTAAAPKPATPKAATPTAAAAAAVAPTDVAVTVAYKGKGAVDAGHKIIVFAFTDANITSNSRPVATQFASKSGDTVTFKNVSAPLYLFAVYDDKGTYDGVSGPPPAGIPSTLYRKAPKGAPTAVAPGSAAVKFTFDDTERWSK